MPLTEWSMNKGGPISGLFSEYSPEIQVFALCYFEPEGIMQKLIHQLKYQGKQSIGAWLGTWCGHELQQQANLPQFEWIIPVPLHFRRKHKRGYNQCTRFGKNIARCLGANYTEKILIRKVFQTTQTTKDKASRLANIRGAFEVVNPAPLKYKNVLLVDDVITTGATLKACCEVLSEIPGIRISIAAMAVVP